MATTTITILDNIPVRECSKGENDSESYHGRGDHYLILAENHSRTLGGCGITLFLHLVSPHRAAISAQSSLDEVVHFRWLGRINRECEFPR